jgi:hypothetical protein
MLFQRVKPCFAGPLIQTAHVNMRSQYSYPRGVMTAMDLQLRPFSFGQLTLVQYCSCSLA